MLATNVVNDANADATNADTISVDDAMEVTAAATAVAFLVAEYYFHDSFRKMVILFNHYNIQTHLFLL